MKILIVRDGEPLPVERTEESLMFHGRFMMHAARKGHSITLVASNFNHYKKSKIKTVIKPAMRNLTLILLGSVGYKRNISIFRILHNIHFSISAVKYLIKNKNKKNYDIIITDIPSIETAFLMTVFSQKNNIPLVIYIRDKRPEVIENVQVPLLLQPLKYIYVNTLKICLRYVLRNADTVIPASHSYRKWALEMEGRCKQNLTQPVFLNGAKENKEGFKFNTAASQPLRFLSLGTYGHTHDLKLLLSLAERLDRSKQTVLTIVGCTTMPETYQKLFGELKNVNLIPWANRKEIVHYVSNSDVGLSLYTNSAPQSLPNKFFTYAQGGLYHITTLKGEMSDWLIDKNCGASIENCEQQLISQIAKVLKNRNMIKKPKILQAFLSEFEEEEQYERMLKACQMNTKSDLKKQRQT